MICLYRWLVLGTFLAISFTSTNNAYSAENENEDGDYKLTIVRAADGFEIQLTDINSFGHACGFVTRTKTSSEGLKGETEAILYKGGEIIYLGSLRKPLSGAEDMYLNTQLPDRSSRANALNDKDQVVGYSLTDSGKRHAFIWENGKMRDMGALDGGESVATDINAHGAIVGYATVSTDSEYPKERAFIYRNGRYISLGTLSGKSYDESWAHAINDKFQIVGSSGKGNNKRGFLYEDGQMKEIGGIDLPKGAFGPDTVVVASDINRNGEIVGELGGVGQAAFIRKDGKTINLNGLANATKVTADGTVLGVMRGRFGCVWQPGHPRRMIDRNFGPDDSLYIPFSGPATGINNYGQLIGVAQIADKETRRMKTIGLIATPKDHDPLLVKREDVPELEEDPFEKDHAKNLLFITHGWNSNADTWVKELSDIFKAELSKRNDLSNWEIVTYDWSNAAKINRDDGVVDPLGAKVAKEKAEDLGRLLGRKYSKENYDNIHLIAHSAGSWVIHQISKEVNNENCFVQITFLDTYVPASLEKTNNLGMYADFAEHYVDTNHKDMEDNLFYVGGTSQKLRYCFNKDVTSQNADRKDRVGFIRDYIDDHGWPIVWYMESAGSGFGLDLSVVLGHNPKHEGEFKRLKDTQEVGDVGSSTEASLGDILKKLEGAEPEQSPEKERSLEEILESLK